MHAVLIHLLKVFFCSSPSAHLRKTFSNWMFGAFFFCSFFSFSPSDVLKHVSVPSCKSQAKFLSPLHQCELHWIDVLDDDVFKQSEKSYTHLFFLSLSFVFCHTLGSLCLNQHACRKENTTSSAKRRLLCLSRPWIELEQKQVKNANKKFCMSNSMRRGCWSHCARSRFCMKSPPMHSLVISSDKI